MPGNHAPSPEAPSTASVSILAVNVRRLRAELGWSTREFADHAGIDPSTLNRIEHGHRPTIRLSTAALVAKALGVHVTVLLTPEAKPRRLWSQCDATETAAKNIVKYRKAKNWTQQELAAEARVSRPMLAKIESQGRNLTLDVLDRLATALGSTAAGLLQSESR